MLKINKLRAHHVLDHAAEELKKYLRMMMPEIGEVEIAFSPDAKDGFRLGLLEDFGLPFEGEDKELDDVIHVDADEKGGILAGSNPRSVLFAVYRFLRENGCRWLYPGVDGDFVPMKDIEPVKYHKMASYRYRGFCNEGSESQTCMLECADYYAKLEMNVYMLEWFIPEGYYNRYYTHLHNEENRIPEPLTQEQILQWKKMCESEISKRGLMFHDIGHGWTAKPFGFVANHNTRNTCDTSIYTQEQRSVLAQINGKRDFYRNHPIFTNVCLSRDDVRRAMVQEVANYAEKSTNVDYLHVWLSDGSRNHCECEECQKMIPSDWYMMLMNEIDEELTRRNLNTRIVFIGYVDTMFAPQKISIRNPERFSLLFAPIARSYTASITADAVIPPAEPYVRNAWKRPSSPEETFAHLKEWQKSWKGPVIFYEYHFWRHQFNDLGGLTLGKRLYEDIRGLSVMGVDGYIEDGSQRSAFPNGFPVYIYAETLMNRDCDFDAVAEDYYSHIYGPDWKDAVSLLQRMGDAFDFAYMEGEKTLNSKISNHYNPDHAARLGAVRELSAEERSLAMKHLSMPKRPQTVSWRLLLRHAEYCEKWAEIMIEKALGHNHLAVAKMKAFFNDFGKYEWEMERYYDHSLACRVLEQINSKPQSIILD